MGQTVAVILVGPSPGSGAGQPSRPRASLSEARPFISSNVFIETLQLRVNRVKMQSISNTFSWLFL